MGKLPSRQHRNGRKPILFARADSCCYPTHANGRRVPALDVANGVRARSYGALKVHCHTARANIPVAHFIFILCGSGSFSVKATNPIPIKANAAAETLQPHFLKELFVMIKLIGAHPAATILKIKRRCSIGVMSAPISLLRLQHSK